ncbi:MAG: glycosyltransferase, partial [Acidobacteriota bacterium]
ASYLITYGVEPHQPARVEVLERLGLEARKYFLYVSRFEPENNPHRVIQAYSQVGGEMPLVMVGHAPYAGRFISDLRQRADSRVIFPGSIYGDGYRELQAGALAYIHATEVGGTHPALVEAMGYGNCLLVNDAPENREVVGDCGLYFRASEPVTLTRLFDQVLAEPRTAADLGVAAANRATQLYSWDTVTRQYAELFGRLADNSAKRPR